MARLTLPEGDPSMGFSPTMDPLTAQLSRKPRLVAPTPRRRLRAAAPPAVLVVLLALTLLALVIASALWVPAARAAGSDGLAPAPALTNDLKVGNTDGSVGLLSPVVARPAILGTVGTLPTATEPVAYAAGSVTVSIIFPQSSGVGGSKHTERWTRTDSYGTPGLTSTGHPKLTPRQVYIVGQIQKALDWWAAEAPAAAHLTFVIPKAGTGAPLQVSVAREPITIASTSDQLWRHPIMAKLGHAAAGSADAPPPETAYDNAVRKANHTDWAFTVYVVDSLHDATLKDKTPGEFPNGSFAYTFALFGPYSVLTYDNATFGPAEFDGVLAHEIGHEFGALDEYAAPAGYPSSGSLFSGYLWVKNLNAVQGGKTNDPCIMRGGSAGLDAYTQSATLSDRGICPSTAGQIGWRVTPPNTLPDVVDTTPTVTLAKPILNGTGATVTGVAAEHPWPPGHNAKGRAFAAGISILTPHALQYSVDGGAWAAVTPTGSGARQSFRFATGTLAAAPAPATTRHVVAVQATTGTTVTSSVVAWTYPTPVVLSLVSSASTIAFGGKVKLTVHAADADAGANADAPTYAIGFLPGVVVGPQGGAAATQQTVTTAAGGSAAVTAAPRFTTTFKATLPTPHVPFTAPTPTTPVTVTVAVRALLAAHAAAPSATRVVRVAGSFRPRRAGVPLVLQVRRAGTWTTVAKGRTAATGIFSLAYAARKGTVLLRVSFAGDARNAAATRTLPAIAVP